MGKWWWCLGGTPLLLFMIQVATGILLLMYYVPGTKEAYESVGHITNIVPFGWFIRSLHKWSANFMIIAIFLHLLRVFFTGAYRSPRQLNWCVGVLLLATTLAFGFSGYSLVYEQMSYWGSTVAMNLIDATPLIGPALAYIVRGGIEIGQGTLTRLYIMHVILLPLAALIFIGLHILLTRLHGVTELRFEGEPTGNEKKTYNLWPEHMTMEIIVGMVVLYLLVVLSLLFPAGLGEVANPLRTPEHIKPEWYFYFSFRLLKLTALKTSVILTGVLGLIIFSWPFIEEWTQKKFGIHREFPIFLGITAFLGFLVLTLWEAFA